MHPANKWLIGLVTASALSSAAFLEGTKYYAYKDIAGIPTVCQGHTGKDVIFGKKYSPEECRAFLEKDMSKAGEGVLNCIHRPLTIPQYNAFTLFALNVGVTGACGSRAFREFNAGNVMEACNALAHAPSGKPAWSYVNGSTYVEGLYKRRLYERKMCLNE
jgi:lysozyme